ncbi:hypothetical protein TIFTF001_028318 [Ficus carica]|uniref:Uncharacterized protein n=1 Tax=Ficus carica TaxID=3494 RepID=A0AA88IWD9_FICCA|nr:hypothetical protein TIFTF001_028318 [Ficus carica]
MGGSSSEERGPGSTVKAGGAPSLAFGIGAKLDDGKDTEGRNSAMVKASWERGGGWVGNGGCLCWLLPFIHPSSIPICLPLGLAPASTVEVWFGDGRVDPND